MNIKITSIAVQLIQKKFHQMNNNHNMCPKNESFYLIDLFIESAPLLVRVIISRPHGTRLCLLSLFTFPDYINPRMSNI